MTTEVRNGADQSAASNVHFLSPDSLKHNNPPRRLQVARIADDPVMQQAMQAIYDQGPRMVLELLSTLSEKNMQACAVEKEIKRFALLPPGALRAIGCDRIKPFHPLEVLQ